MKRSKRLTLFSVSLIVSLALYSGFKWLGHEKSDDRKLHELGLILLVYESDHSGRFPESLDELVAQNYANSSQLRPNPPFDASGGEYTFFVGGKIAAMLDTNDIVAADPDSSGRSSGNILMADGSTVFLTGDAFKVAIKTRHVRIGK